MSLYIYGEPEPFTNGKVSADARRAVLSQVPKLIDEGAFRPCRGGYQMTAWQSQIDMARAMGRGVASGKGKPVHRFDVKQSQQTKGQ